MRRRDISKALFATAAGSTVAAAPVEAQTCTAPCYAQTTAESAAGVTPVNYAYPFLDVRRYGAVGNGTTDDTAAFNAAIKACYNTDGAIVVAATAASYILTSGLTLGNANNAARIYGSGQPTLSFVGLSGTDAITMTGSSPAYRQHELRGLIINLNGSGRDAVVLNASSHPILDNVWIMNPGRDGFSIQCSSYGWVEKGEFNLMVYNAGRHGVLMSTAGSDGAFINECIWRQYVLRGVSALIPGGNAIRMTSTATGGGSKISDHYIEKSSWDCGYNSGNPVPDVSPINIDSGVAQNFLITTGGWENTGNAGSPGIGPACNVTGSGAWSGLTLIANITNAFWGQGAPPLQCQI